MEKLEMKWIPVKERLPEEDGFYLVTRKITDCFNKNYYDVSVVEFTTNVEHKNHEYLSNNVDFEAIGTGPRFIDWEDEFDYGELTGYVTLYIFDDVIAWAPIPNAYKED